MQLENMTTEILEPIISAYSDDEDLLSTVLFFLYHTSNDDKLRANIEKVMTEIQRCIECGDKMIEWHWQEYHSELGEYEDCSIMDCLRCSDLDKEKYNVRIE